MPPAPSLDRFLREAERFARARFGDPPPQFQHQAREVWEASLSSLAALSNLESELTKGRPELKFLFNLARWRNGEKDLKEKELAALMAEFRSSLGQIGQSRSGRELDAFLQGVLRNYGPDAYVSLLDLYFGIEFNGDQKEVSREAEALDRARERAWYLRRKLAELTDGETEAAASSSVRDFVLRVRPDLQTTNDAATAASIWGAESGHLPFARQVVEAYLAGTDKADYAWIRGKKLSPLESQLASTLVLLQRHRRRGNEGAYQVTARDRSKVLDEIASRMDRKRVKEILSQFPIPAGADGDELRSALAAVRTNSSFVREFGPAPEAKSGAEPSSPNLGESDLLSEMLDVLGRLSGREAISQERADRIERSLVSLTPETQLKLLEKVFSDPVNFEGKFGYEGEAIARFGAAIPTAGRWREHFKKGGAVCRTANELATRRGLVLVGSEPQETAQALLARSWGVPFGARDLESYQTSLGKTGNRAGGEAVFDAYREVFGLPASQKETVRRRAMAGRVRIPGGTVPPKADRVEVALTSFFSRRALGAPITRSEVEKIVPVDQENELVRAALAEQVAGGFPEENGPFGKRTVWGEGARKELFEATWDLAQEKGIVCNPYAVYCAIDRFLRVHQGRVLTTDSLHDFISPVHHPGDARQDLTGLNLTREKILVGMAAWNLARGGGGEWIKKIAKPYITQPEGWVMPRGEFRILASSARDPRAEFHKGLISRAKELLGFRQSYSERGLWNAATALADAVKDLNSPVPEEVLEQWVRECPQKAPDLSQEAAEKLLEALNEWQEARLMPAATTEEKAPPAKGGETTPQEAYQAARELDGGVWHRRVVNAVMRTGLWRTGAVLDERSEGRPDPSAVLIGLAVSGARRDTGKRTEQDLAVYLDGLYRTMKSGAAHETAARMIGQTMARPPLEGNLESSDVEAALRVITRAVERASARRWITSEVVSEYGLRVAEPKPYREYFQQVGSVLTSAAGGQEGVRRILGEAHRELVGRLGKFWGIACTDAAYRVYAAAEFVGALLELPVLEAEAAAELLASASSVENLCDPQNLSTEEEILAHLFHLRVLGQVASADLFEHASSELLRGMKLAAGRGVPEHKLHQFEGTLMKIRRGAKVTPAKSPEATPLKDEIKMESIAGNLETPFEELCGRIARDVAFTKAATERVKPSAAQYEELLRLVREATAGLPAGLNFMSFRRWLREALGKRVAGEIIQSVIRVTYEAGLIPQADLRQIAAIPDLAEAPLSRWLSGYLDGDEEAASREAEILERVQELRLRDPEGAAETLAEWVASGYLSRGEADAVGARYAAAVASRAELEKGYRKTLGVDSDSSPDSRVRSEPRFVRVTEARKRVMAKEETIGNKVWGTMTSDAQEIALRSSVRQGRELLVNSLAAWVAARSVIRITGESDTDYQARVAASRSGITAFFLSDVGQGLIGYGVGMGWVMAEDQITDETLLRYGAKISREIRIQSGTDVADEFIREVVGPVMTFLKEQAVQMAAIAAKGISEEPEKKRIVAESPRDAEQDAEIEALKARIRGLEEQRSLPAGTDTAARAASNP